jgi:hypothetical protein
MTILILKLLLDWFYFLDTLVPVLDYKLDQFNFKPSNNVLMQTVSLHNNYKGH